ncbi:hypothetical protein VKT23_008961 [Stygiomarasmius scandens]|uniref:ribonuclease H n=1 Tax=Marasmiellus scandens TaxID=2682957 RepID=A0ABR1JG13_9AGAR
MLRARELLDTLPEKWDPRAEQPEDHEGEFTRLSTPREEYLFDYRLSMTGDMSSIFRIFTDKEQPPTNAVFIRRLRTNDPNNVTEVATDGSCINNGQENALAGAGVYFTMNDERNKSIKLPKMSGNTPLTLSNQAGELLAAKLAPELIRKEYHLRIETDSKYVISHLTTSLRKMEDNGYIGVENAPLIKAMVANYRTRESLTKIKWVKGHSGHPGNEAADDLAKKAVEKNETDEVELNIPSELQLSGAKLCVLTQSLAYNAIRIIKTRGTEDRRRTRQNLELTKIQVKELFGISPRDVTIWRSIRSKDLERKTRYFLWMTIHDAYMTGTNWDRPGYSDEMRQRATCPHDHKTEDMTHILTGCESPGQEVIWNLVGELWARKTSTPEWEHPGLGVIMGAGLVQLTTRTGKRKSGEERLWRILISESAYLIWKLRCERVIQNENTPFSQTEVKNRWTYMINERLQLDRRMTSWKYGKKSLSPGLVEATWKGLLKAEGLLPHDWVTNTGVLVGIESDLRRRTGPRGR